MTMAMADAGPSPDGVSVPCEVFMAIIIGVYALEMPGSAVDMICGSLNSWMVPTMDSSMASSAAPRTFGSLIFMATWKPLAPSMRAASYRSCGMACSAARKISML